MKGWTDPKSNLSVGIVVPVYNEAATLDHYLSRLYEVTRGRYPVVVVDGGSSDNTRDIARRYFDTECVPLPNRGAQLNHGAQCLASKDLNDLTQDLGVGSGVQQVSAQLRWPVLCPPEQSMGNI